jgi:hypothetical protein
MTEPPDFLSGDADGETFEHNLDRARLDTQRGRLWAVMRDGQWHTPEEISARTGDNWASAGARMRDLRKGPFGEHTVERERVGDPHDGLYRYRLIPNLPPPPGPPAGAGNGTDPLLQRYLDRERDKDPRSN